MLRKTLKKLNAFLLVACIVLLQFSINAVAVAYPASGKVTYTGGASIYSQPGYIDGSGHDGRLDKTKPSDKIGTLANGEMIKVLGEAKDGDGDMWYHINYGENLSKEGYAFAKRITLIGSYTEDTDFENWLTEQNFPETYKVKLRDLHSLYPNWVFYADHIDLEWADVIAAESKTGRKLVHKTMPNSWKSMSPEAYDAKTNTWYEFDSGGWVAASETVVKYYTDPRNFLDAKSIFMFSSHSYDETYDTKENLMNMISGKFLDADLPSPPDNEGMTYADAILNAAKAANVSPFVIASTILQEQGSQGGGGNISGTVPGYEGYFNFFNIGAYAVGGMTAVQRGVWYASGEGSGKTSYNRPWNTREKSITGGAMWYADGYLSVGQDTYYYMNFDVIANGGLYNHQYATNIKDTVDKATFLASAYSDVMDSNLVFHIPVYKNMPQSTELPAENGDNNNYLSAIEVTGHTLANFNPYTYQYELIVNNEVSSIEIKATPSSPAATVTGTGKVNLNVGDNQVRIKVKASSGEERIYMIDVNRLPSATPEPTPTITGSYKIGDYLTGVALKTTVADFKTKLAVKDGTAKVFDKNGTEKTSGNIGTGDTVKIYNKSGVEKLKYDILIYGDTDGNGIIDEIDLATVKMVYLKKYELKGIYYKAGNPSRSGQIAETDLAMVKMAYLNKYTIEQ